METWKITITEDITGDIVKEYTKESKRMASRLYSALLDRYDLARVTISMVKVK